MKVFGLGASSGVSESRGWGSWIFAYCLMFISSLCLVRRPV